MSQSETDKSNNELSTGELDSVAGGQFSTSSPVFSIGGEGGSTGVKSRDKRSQVISGKAAGIEVDPDLEF